MRGVSNRVSPWFLVLLVVAVAGGVLAAAGTAELVASGSSVLFTTGVVLLVLGVVGTSWQAFQGQRTAMPVQPLNPPFAAAPPSPLPLGAAAGIVGHLRADGRRAVVTLDTHEAWPAGRDDVLALARRVDVFVPSHGELAALLGYDDPERACRELQAEGVPAGPTIPAVNSSRIGDTPL